MEPGAWTYAASLSLTLLWGLCVLLCALFPAGPPLGRIPIVHAQSPIEGPAALNLSNSQGGEASGKSPRGKGPLNLGLPAESSTQSRLSSHRSTRGAAPALLASKAARGPDAPGPRGRALTAGVARARHGRRPRAKRTPKASLSLKARVALMPPNDSFVRRSGQQLVLGGRTFHANGFNTYWLMYIASIPEQRYLVPKVLGQAQALGLTVCRTLAFYDGGGWHALQPSLGVFNEDTFQALDYVVDTASQFGIGLHLVLTNNWNDYGGKAQYVEWSRSAGSSLPSDDTAFFVDAHCHAHYKQFVRALILRRNTRTGLVYRDDPTIFGWELINEPRTNDDPSGDVLQSWIMEMATHVKSLDANHLLSIGAEGFYGPSTPQRQFLNAESWMSRVGTDFVRNNQVPGIDIASVHAYANSRYSASQWSDKLQYYEQYIQGHIDDCTALLGMPLLLGEFGPDSVRGPDGSLDKRNQVYQATYSIMLGSARRGGSGAVSMFWQLMVDELASWDDGTAVYMNSQRTTAAIIRDQSKAFFYITISSEHSAPKSDEYSQPAIPLIAELDNLKV